LCANFGWRIFFCFGVIGLKKNVIRLCFIIGILINSLCFLGTNVNATTVASGNCGENLTWLLNNEGTLIISGTGEMDNYYNTAKPWWTHRNSIRKIVVENGITSIGKCAFEYCSEITSIDIGNSVTSIGDMAFLGCGGLTNVVIADSVTSIGDSAFSNCTGLTSIVIPDSVTEIGDFTFNNCSELTKLTLGQNVVDIGSNAFSRCTKLNVIYWNAISVNNYIDTYNEPFYKIGIDSNNLSVVFGEKVKCVPENAFYNCTGLRGITIPDSVTNIGEKAFYNCTGLTNVSIGEGVISVGNDAFYGTKWYSNHPDGLVNIGKVIYEYKGTMPSETHLSIPNTITGISGKAFYNCTGLRGITIPDSVTNIGEKAFYNCTGLTNITIPDGVTSIGGSAFEGCTGLTSIDIPDSVTNIGDRAFYNCSGLTNITIPAGITVLNDNLFSSCSTLKSITIPDSVKLIGNSVFSDCTELTSITIPQNVKKIRSGVFRGCSKLVDISVCSNNEKYSSVEGVLFSLGNRTLECFPAGKYGQYYTIPDTVSFVSPYAFSGCNGLICITIPDSVTSFGRNTFENCIGLTNITIPNGVTSIGSELFKDCTGLISIDIPDSVTNIGTQAFYNCAGLTNITIPDGVTSISSGLFKGCTGLTSITIPDSVTSIENDAFSDCTNLATIYWNAVNITNNYISSTYHPFKNVGTSGVGFSVIFGDCVNAIPQNAFYDCTGLASVTISDSVTAIGCSAFSGCTGLHSVIIPKGVASIEDSTFAGCTSLTDITIPSGVTSIGYSAFFNCTNLESIYFMGTLQRWKSITVGSYNNSLIDAKVYCLGDEYQVEFKISNNKLISYMGDETDLIIPSMIYGVTIKGIAYDVFSNSPQIRSITIPHTVTYIDENFGNLTNLERITVDEENTYYSSIDGVLFNKDQTILIAYPSAKQGEYIIPDTVEEICANAFNNATGLTSVTIPQKVSIIQDNAFVNCYNLKYIYWNAANVQDNHPSADDNFLNVYFQNIGNANGGCEVIFGDTVETIPRYAFYKCDGLKKVTISGNVNSIGYRSFQYCKDLESITVSADNTTFASHNGVLYNKDLTKLIQCPSGKTGDYIIPDSNIIIGENGFAGCDKLDSIAIPKNIKIIAQWAFYDCKDNVKINWNCEEPLGDREFHLEYGYSKTQDWFNKPVGIIIGNSVETVPEYFFSGCTNISNVTLHLNVKEIGVSAFNDCNSITDVYYQGTTNQWKKIMINEYNEPILDAIIHCSDGIYVYEYTASQKFVFSDGVITGYIANDVKVKIPRTINGIDVTAIGENAFKDNAELQSITIPDTVISIGSSAFSGCMGLASVAIPDSVTSIGESAFGECTALSNVKIPKNITTIEARVFAGCSLLKSVEIPQGVTTIKNFAFSDCTSLAELNIPDSVTKIYEGAFEDCTELKSVILPDTVRSIDYRMFAGCTGLESIIIPDSVAIIDMNAFYGCTGLNSIVIPENIITIGANAFGECTQLTDVHFRGSPEQWDMIYNIREGNEALLNANIHYHAEVSESPIISLSETQIDINGVTDNYMLVVSSYKNNVLIDTKFIVISSATTLMISETGLDTTGANTIKAFLWEDIQSMKPICEAQSIKIEGKTPLLSLTESQVSVSGINEKSSLIIATYNDSTMVDAKVIGISSDTIKAIAETGINTDGANIVKAFLWDDMQTMSPICDVQSILIE